MAASSSPHLTVRAATRKVVLSTARAERHLAGRKDGVNRRHRLRTAVAAVRAMAKSLPAYLAEQRRLRAEPKHKKLLRALRAPITPRVEPAKKPGLVSRLRRLFSRRTAP